MRSHNQIATLAIRKSENFSLEKTVEVTYRTRLTTLILLAWTALAVQTVTGQSPNSVFFKNVKVFDGASVELSASTSVLVEGDKITKIGGSIEAPPEAEVIDGQGGTLMPGLIDNHWHSMFATIPQAKLMTADIGYINVVAARDSRGTLLRGFTSVRDVGGPVFGLKQAIDEELIVGPRIFPCGPYISQTAGHGDFRAPTAVPSNPGEPLTYHERVGVTLIADGVPEVTKRTREALRMGASQIKVMAGGGVSSLYDPLDVTQYTFDEMKAIVDVADTWNTYVTVHAFTNDSVRQAVKAGVRCIEHGHLLDEETIKLLAEKDVWLSMQPILDDEDAIPFAEGSASRKKFVEVTGGTDLVYRLARLHKVKLAWGTDTLFDPKLADKQGKQLIKLSRWFTPAQILKMATHDNAELLALCGKRNPYPGKLGVVAEGALADLLLVDGDPLDDLTLIADPDKNLVVIMKNGKIYKNNLK